MRSETARGREHGGITVGDEGRIDAPRTGSKQGLELLHTECLVQCRDWKLTRLEAETRSQKEHPAPRTCCALPGTGDIARVDLIGGAARGSKLLPWLPPPCSRRCKAACAVRNMPLNMRKWQSQSLKQKNIGSCQPVPPNFRLYKWRASPV
jgi:hypothetical protein